MTEWGVCDNAVAPETTLTVEDAVRWDAKLRRTITYPGQFQKAIDSARILQAAGIRSLLVFTTESAGCDFNDHDTYDAQLKEFLVMSDGAFFAVETQNELDTPEWGIKDADIIDAAKRAADVCHDKGVLAYSPSLIGDPAAGRFKAWARGMEDHCDVMVVHPYFCSVSGQPYPNWLYGTIEDKARICAELTQKPLCFSEVGFPRVYLGMTAKEQANCTIALRNWQHPQVIEVIQFCYNNLMVPGGEVTDGKYWGIQGEVADRRLSGMDEIQFVLGFEKWHDLEPDLIGDPVANEKGPWEGMSQQLTTRGLLSWTPSGFTFWELETHKMYAWQPDRASSSEVS